MDDVNPKVLTATMLLQQLIRYDTTNPPGHTAACIAYVREYLAAAGIESRVYAKDPARPNLVARIRGKGNAAPLLLYGHVDVVPTAEQSWTHPPFAGEIIGGDLWGRGALDMKDGVAMFVTALARAVRKKTPLPGDVILAVLSDEENGSAYGAKHLVERHPELFAGVRYALGEFGGFSLNVAGRRFYMIQVAEKQASTIMTTLTGASGHVSFIYRGEAMGKLGRLLTNLDGVRLPVHVTPPAREMYGRMAAALPWPKRVLLRLMLHPALTDWVLPLLGTQRKTFEPMLRNTVNATIVRGGVKLNVIPERVEVQMDGRLLPGYTPDDLIRELRPIVGPNVALEATRYVPSSRHLDMGLFDQLGGILRDMDPEGVPIPLLLPGTTDARYFSQLGIQTYGFLPMHLPTGFPFEKLIHAADERVPVDAVEFGAEAVFRAIQMRRE